MVAAANIPAGEHVPTADHRVVVAGATWEHYELELAMRGETRGRGVERSSCAMRFRPRDRADRHGREECCALWS